MSDEGRHAGELASTPGGAISQQGLKKSAFCECGERASLVVENGRLVGYACHIHGPLTHDALVWAWEGDTDLF